MSRPKSSRLPSMFSSSHWWLFICWRIFFISSDECRMVSRRIRWCLSRHSCLHMLMNFIFEWRRDRSQSTLKEHLQRNERTFQDGQEEGRSIDGLSLSLCWRIESKSSSMFDIDLHRFPSERRRQCSRTDRTHWTESSRHSVRCSTRWSDLRSNQSNLSRSLFCSSIHLGHLIDSFAAAGSGNRRSCRGLCQETSSKQWSINCLFFFIFLERLSSRRSNLVVSVIETISLMFNFFSSVLFALLNTYVKVKVVEDVYWNQCLISIVIVERKEMKRILSSRWKKDSIVFLTLLVLLDSPKDEIENLCHVSINIFTSLTHHYRSSGIKHWSQTPGDWLTQ